MKQLDVDMSPPALAISLNQCNWSVATMLNEI